MGRLFRTSSLRLFLVLFCSLAVHLILVHLIEGLVSEELSTKPYKVKLKSDLRVIVEAPMPESHEKAVGDIYLGAQDRSTSRPQKLPPTENQPEQDSSRFLNSLNTPRGYGDWSPVGKVSVYNDYIAENLPIGQILDVNTSKYRYLGYMTQLRKSIELALYNPLSELKKVPHIYQRLSRGEKVNVAAKSSALITIERSGLVSSVEIVESTGNKVIDKAWKKIINLAAPFGPIPKQIREQQLRVKYTLHYGTVLEDGEEKRLFRF